jgi:electron transfer flavoprotein beta subunit
MKICVCLKEVPPSLVALRLDPDTGRLVRGKGRLNTPDTHALEEALRLRDAVEGTEVVTLTMAPEHATESVRHGLAVGVDRAVLVSDPALAGSDLLVTSRVLAAALEREQPDLVLCGWEGTDGNGAMLWAAVAERLGLPSISRAWELTVAADRVRARRQMEYGFDVAEAPLPCVVAISGAINAPRYPALKGIVAAKKKTIEVLTAADLGLGADAVGAAGSGTRVLRVGQPPARTPGLLIDDPERAPEQLLEHLERRGII